MNSKPPNILIDAREFVDRRTGISRFLEGLVSALCASELQLTVTLALFNGQSPPLPFAGKNNVKVAELPHNYLQAERRLSGLSNRTAALYISPYPKLPLTGCGCRAVHTIHDVLDLTHAAYRRSFKTYFDRLRLKTALQRAQLTWFASAWSKQKTEELIGSVGTNPKVRHNGIDEDFTPVADQADAANRRRYGLATGYVLVIGNGKPHKNLGILLSISQQISRTLVIVGVSPRWKDYWMRTHPSASVVWIEYAADEVVPSLIRGAHCMALPSLEEGFGYPPLEAMACGVPPVVSRIPVLLETTGGNALTADPGKAEEWLQAFQALEDPPCYKQSVEKGLLWAGAMQGAAGWRGHVEDIAGLLHGSIE